MGIWRRLESGLSWFPWYRRQARDADLERELRDHLDLEADEQRAAGLSPEEAVYAAHRALGNTLMIEEDVRAVWGLQWLETIAQDVRYAFRMLRKAPGFTAIAALTLALGIGANTAIFSVVNAIYLSPLPYPNASKIYVVSRIGDPFGREFISPAIFAAWREQQAGAFEHLALLHWAGAATLTGFGDALQVPAMGISVDFLAMLGVHAALGRDFAPEEGAAGGPNVVMLGNSLWRMQFGANPNVVGRSITLDDKPYTIIGVLPPGFEDPSFSSPHAQLWFPVRIPATTTDVGNGGLLCLGMLKRGVSIAQAEASLTPSLSALRDKYPKMFMPGERAHLIPLRQLLNGWAGTAPLLLFGAVGLVLLIACANLASLTLARSATRQREIAVRTAMGAGRERIVRQLLTESALLAVLGGAIGVAACYASLRFIIALVPKDLMHVGAYQIDTAVLGFAFALSIVTGIVFGLVPALGTSRVDLNNALKESSAQSGAGRSGRMRSVLASGELAISLVLIVGAALALESFARLTGVNPGFDSSKVLTFSVQLTTARYALPASRSAFLDQALARLSALPGTEEAATSSILPLTGGADILFSMVGGNGSVPPGEPLVANIRVVSPDYFHALRIPLVRGRVSTASDNAAGPPVVVIDETMAKKFWPGKDPVGQEIWIGKPMGPEHADPTPRQIIGVVGDVRESSLAENGGQTMFIPYAQTKFNNFASFIVRTRRAPMLSLPDARSTLRSLDANLPLLGPETMDSVVADSLSGWRFHAVLLGVFGALALLIAAIGVYGVISYSVAQRTHEIGVRMALGAQRGDVMRLVIGQGALLAGAGIVVGVGAAFGLTRLMASMLYGVKPTDPLTFSLVAILLTFSALLACYIPTRRAMRVDPMVALRYE
ncbi:MAG TPA: ABC transporter permease [Candidatus Acidoferrum sp.]|jgi:putative ABC transport system permease protein|nr:ABC transporter permease [Candidatus Acidoferrum sp.]